MSFSPPSPEDAPDVSDVHAAARRLSGIVARTPLLESPLLNRRAGRRILVKPECLQVTGSFKFRGASNKIGSLTDAQKKAGVVAYSSGNHAQGVAAAAHYAGIPALIVMPDDAPAIKRANTEAWGADVHVFDRFGEDRIAIAERLAEERGAALVRPYDDPMIIAGQGTAGLELVEQLDERGIEPAAVAIPCGGGGLAAGMSLALKDQWPDVPILGVEPEDFDDTARSLAAGERLRIRDGVTSICDCILSFMPGIITFEINRRTMAGVATVSDREALGGMAAAYEFLKVIAEPGGAAALAAILEGRLPPGDQPVVAVISGGNVDPQIFSQALA